MINWTYKPMWNVVTINILWDFTFKIKYCVQYYIHVHTLLAFNHILTYQPLQNYNTAGATCGAGTAYPSEAPEFTLGFSVVHVTRSLVLSVCFVNCCFPFEHFLLAIVFSFLLRYTDSDYPFGIFKRVL